MRIARTAATLVLVFAPAACGTSGITGPEGDHRHQVEPPRPAPVPLQVPGPQKSGNLLGSGY